MIKSNGSGVEGEVGKGLEENNRDSKTLMFFIITKLIASSWESISRCLGLNTDSIKVMQKKYHDPCECAYQVLLELDDKNDLQWDDIESALIESKEVSLSVLKKVKEDLRKHISSFQVKPIEKDEQCHAIWTEWNVVITSHTSFKDIEELGIQVDNHETKRETISKKRICLFHGANFKQTLNKNQWKSKCGEYMEKYYAIKDFFTFNYDTDKVPDSLKDFLEKNQPGFLIKDYSLYKNFELLGMLSFLEDHQVEVLQHIKMDHIGFEATNKTIYFFKISNAKTVHDLKQDIDDCALYVQMFLLLHKNELEGVIACLMSFIVIPTECEGLINDITDNFCSNCKQYVITMNQFLNFDKLLSKGIKAVIKKTTKENWKKLEKSFDFKNFKHRMGTIFGVMANQEGDLVPNLSNDISEQLDNVRILLYPQQVSIANSDDKHVLLKGGHGSGKTIMGRILLKKICSNFPNEILYYINFAASPAFTEDMQDYVNHIGCNNNVICCDRTRFKSNECVSDIINEIKKKQTSQIHLIFDEVSLDEFGEKDIMSFCDVLNELPYRGAFCFIICQAMTKQRTLKENGVIHMSSFMDQTQRLIEQSSFIEKTLNECLRYTAKIDKLVEIARVMLESAVNKFNNKEIMKKDAMLRKTPQKSNTKQKPELNSASNKVPSETTLGESQEDAQTPLTKLENRANSKSNSNQGSESNSLINFDAAMKKVNPTPLNIVNNAKIIESHFGYVKDSKVLHNIKVTEPPRLYFPFDKKNSFSPFENVYLMMLCFEHLFESRYIDSDEKIVVIHLDDETPGVLLKALRLYEKVLDISNFENIEFKKCLDVQGAEYKNVIVFFSVAEYHMRHFLIEAITRCKCNLAFFVMKENWELAKEEVLWNIIQTWIKSTDNEEKLITAFYRDNLEYKDDEQIKLQDLYENELKMKTKEIFSLSSDDKDKAAENVAKSMKNLGIAEEDRDDEDEVYLRNENEIYQMKCNPHGNCIIINIVCDNVDGLSERTGTEVDRKRLERLFKWLNYNVMCYNLNVQQIRQRLTAVANDSDMECDSLVVIILSHGDNEGFYGSCGGKLSYDELFRICDTELLKGKPKLFFVSTFQVYSNSRTQSSDSNLFRSQEEIVRDTFTQNRGIDDLYCFTSTAPGSLSIRMKDGTWFAQTLCDVFEEHASTHALVDLEVKINNAVSKKETQIDIKGETVTCKMIPNIKMNTLYKGVCFNPECTFAEFC